MPNATDTSELSQQWQNPGDILSLLLLVGGDIVQKALAQLVGVRVPRQNSRYGINITPVAFSFGWVAYGFQSLMTIFGENRLMPDPDCDILVVNCSNAFVRQNSSWVLGRLVRDYERTVEEATAVAPVDSQGEPRPISLKIDVFRTDAVHERHNPRAGWSWYVAWLVILLQQVLAFIPWILYGDWATFVVTICGTVFALTTGAIPQWAAEKWSSRYLTREKTVALTRGNGRQYVMVIICAPGSLDLEAMATARLVNLPETRWIMLSLTIMWTLLLITVSGLHLHTWFLVGVGGIGMLQNIYFAAVVRSGDEFRIPLRPHEDHPTIIGYRMDQLKKGQAKETDDYDSDEDPFGAELPPPSKPNDINDVMGAICELEKQVPKAGASILPVFFDSGLQYEPTRFVFNTDKKFWKLAFRRFGRPVPRR